MPLYKAHSWLFNVYVIIYTLIQIKALYGGGRTLKIPLQGQALLFGF